MHNLLQTHPPMFVGIFPSRQYSVNSQTIGRHRIEFPRFDPRLICLSVQVKLWNVDTKECAMAFKGHNAEASTSCS